MNFITSQAAYSLYPRATFTERTSLPFEISTIGDTQALAKYENRGWRTINDDSELVLANSFFPERIRRVGDSGCWVLPLDMAGVAPPSDLPPDPLAMKWDPSTMCTWTLRISRDPIRMFMTYWIVNPPIFRYTYLMADCGPTVNRMLPFFRAQGRKQWTETRGLSDEDKKKKWLWYDLPAMALVN